MKQLAAWILLIAITLLCNACVSRTYTTQAGKETTSEKTLIWIWQDDFRVEQ